MGIFNSLFGSNTPKKISKTSSEKSSTLKQKTDKLRAENHAWKEEFDKITTLRKNAQKLEKENKLEKAISVYIQSIEFAEKSDRLNFKNFAFDVQRVIILLSKTKQNEKLKEFLNSQIAKHPNEKEVNSWKNRLNKISKN